MDSHVRRLGFQDGDARDDVTEGSRLKLHVHPVPHFMAYDKAGSPPIRNPIQLVSLPKGCVFVLFKQICTNSGTRHCSMETNLYKSEVILTRCALGRQARFATQLPIPLLESISEKHSV